MNILPKMAALCLACSSAWAWAADAYPNRPIRIVVNSGAGALLDSTARAVAQEMSKILQQPIVIENKAGADGLLGIRYAKSQAADGYTVLASANTVAQLPALRGDTGYSLDDFQGIGIMSQAPLILVGTPNQADKTLAQLVRHAQAQPGTLTFASGGVGTSTHMAAARFLSDAGIKLMHVPYKGNAAAVPDVIAGRINMIFDGANSAYPNVKEGKLRAFGISSSQRSPNFPEIPTIAEQGYPGYAFEVYMGLLVRTGTPAEIQQELARALKQALGTQAVKNRLQADGAAGGTVFLGDFSRFLKTDYERTVHLSKTADLSK
jgi:tripartite-type tricarboxylate transporter receptor subunit TctC